MSVSSPTRLSGLACVGPNNGGLSSVEERQIWQPDLHSPQNHLELQMRMRLPQPRRATPPIPSQTIFLLPTLLHNHRTISQTLQKKLPPRNMEPSPNCRMHAHTLRQTSKRNHFQRRTNQPDHELLPANNTRNTTGLLSLLNTRRKRYLS